VPARTQLPCAISTASKYLPATLKLSHELPILINKPDLQQGEQMREDFTPRSGERSQPSRKSEDATGTGASFGQADSVAADTICSDSTRDLIAGLRSHLDRVPDIRHRHVESLRLAIRTGRFAISPAMIAHRMLA